MSSRSRRSRWRDRGVCVAAVAIVTGAWVSPAGAAPPRWIRILGETDAGLELLLEAPEPRVEDGALGLSGFLPGGEPGRPQAFEQAVTIAIPGPRGARLEVLSMDEVDLGAVPRRIQPRVTPQGERLREAAAGRAVSDWIEAAPKPLTGPSPERAVVLGGVARLRGRDVVTLHFLPLRHHPDGRATCVRSARVRIVFADQPRPRPEGAAAPEPLHATLLNATSASRWELSSARAAERVAGTALPSERLRIRLTGPGIYSIGYAALRNAGLPVDDPLFDPRTLRLYFDRWKPRPAVLDSTASSWQPDAGLEEAAIWVPGEGDGFSATDPGDRVVFYAVGPQGYEDLAGTSTDSLLHYRHPYDNASYAWLVWNGDFGARMATVPAAVPGGSTPPVVDRVRHREHFERDLGFDAVDDLWYWEEARPARVAPLTFTIDAGGAAPFVSGDLHVTLGYGDMDGRHLVAVAVNDTVRGTNPDFLWPGPLGRRFTFAGVPLRAGTNAMEVRALAGHTARGTYVLYLDAVYVRPLRRTTSASFLAWSARADVPSAAVFELHGFRPAPAPLVLDVTDPLRPVRLVGVASVGGGTDPGWRAYSVRPAGAVRHFMAVESEQAVAASDLVRRDLAPLGSRPSAPDMLIVTHPTLRAAADRLAAHRWAHFPGGTSNPDIAIVSTTDIYESFSGGRLDPMAIRDYARFLYGLDPEPRLRYVLLLGDGSRDHRRLLAGTPETLVPAFEPAYTDPAFIKNASAYAVDDWFGEMERPANGSPPYPVPDVGIGRLAARSLGEAQRIVDKIVAYETASGFGPWRARVLLAGDDECHPGVNGSCSENFHILNSEDLADLVPLDLDVVKFYMTEYPAFLGQKPQARAAFIRTWSEGCAVLNYQGHGAPRQLADEVLFLSTDVPALANGARLPLFLPISCTVSEFDDPERQSMCEDLISSAAGGAIATIGATTPTYVGPNFGFNLALFEQLFAAGATTRIPVGIIHQLAKRFGPVTSGGFNETYLLLADPAMPLDLPQALVRFTSGADSIRTGARQRIEGVVVSAADSTTLAGFSGQVDVEVRGSDDTSGYTTGTPPGVLRIPYDLPGPPLYRGTAVVQAGRFGFDFIVPVGAKLGTQGRVSAYASGAAIDARGEVEDLVVRLGGAPDSSVAAPRIFLRFPNDRTRVKAGTLLQAEIRDENGINIQGTSPRNSIYLDFDRNNEQLNVTDTFRYAAGSDTLGTLTVPLPAELEPGPHVATLLASDNLLHKGTASIEFQVVEEDVVRLVNVLAFPNPLRTSTQFFFEITDPARVELVVFTPNGRPVWRTEQHVETGSRASIPWDGVDLQEDGLANGTYLYRLRAVPDRSGAPALEYIGKIVIMR